MSDFDDAIPTILRHEGGFENDPNGGWKCWVRRWRA